MHVRIAWEIYHHQAKQNPEKANSVTPSSMKAESMMSSVRPHELQTPSRFPPTPPSLPTRPFDPLSPNNFLTSPSTLGK